MVPQRCNICSSTFFDSSEEKYSELFQQDNTMLELEIPEEWEAFNFTLRNRLVEGTLFFFLIIVSYYILKKFLRKEEGLNLKDKLEEIY